MSTDSSTPADPTRGPAPDTDPSASSSATAAALPAAGSTSTVRGLLDEERGWVRALLILSTFAVLFVVLGFLASYFQDYLGIILIFFFAWFIAFLVTPPVDWIERHLPRMPRPMAVILILVPVLAVCGGVVVVRKAKSQSKRAMDRQEFQASKQALIDACADLLGVTHEALTQNAGAAA